MDNSEEIFITATAGISSVGDNVEETCASISSGIMAIDDSPLMFLTPEDPEWEEPLDLLASQVPHIPMHVSGSDRFSALCQPVLSQIFSKLKLRRDDLSRVSVSIALPEKDRSTLKLNLDSLWLTEMQEATGLSACPSFTGLCEGHTSFYSLLNQARERLLLEPSEICIIGGVDTYLFKDRISLLDEQWRVKSNRNVDGFVPGEACFFVAIETASSAARRGVAPLAKLSNQGFADEARTIFGRQNSSAEGLTKALLQLNEKGYNSTLKANIFCDLNGESYRGNEWGLGSARVASHLFPEGYDICHPADCIGDIGAAMPPLLVSLVANLLKNSGTKHENFILYGASDRGKRATLRLSAANHY